MGKFDPLTPEEKQALFIHFTKKENSMTKSESDSFDPQSLVGLDKEEAFQIAKDNDRRYRTKTEDGKGFPITYDLACGRLNFVIDNGKITSVYEEKITILTEAEARAKRGFPPWSFPIYTV